MKQIVINATEARNNFFDIMTAVKYGNQEVLVTKNKKKMVKIVSIDGNDFDWKKYIADWKINRKKIRENDWSDLGQVRDNFELRYRE